MERMLVPLFLSRLMQRDASFHPEWPSQDLP